MNINSILIVDDEAIFCSMLVEMLKDKAKKTVSANCGSKALKLLSRDKFDVVITDINMPDMNGFQLLECIKFVDPIVPVIMMTGYNSIYDMREAIEKGANEYIVKPFKKEEIDVYIDRAVLLSLSKRSKTLQKYITVTNNLIIQSNEPNKDELMAIGKRLLMYATTIYLEPSEMELAQKLAKYTIS
jgi:DNA-binding NtrC family response regulator